MRRFRGGVLLLALLLLGGCESDQYPLRVGSNPWAGYLTLAYAAESGMLDPVQVRLLAFDSTQEVMRAFRNRAVDAAAVTLDEALLLGANRQDPVVVLAFDASAGADSLLARPEITTLADLRGRRIAVETNALGAYLLARVLEIAGLTPEDVHILNLTPENHLQAYRQGRVDAVITFDPQRSQLLATGAHELFSSRQIPGEVVDVLIVRRETLEQRTSALQAVADAHFASLEVIRKTPETAAERLAGGLDVSPQELRDAWGLVELYDRDANRRLLGESPGNLAGTLQRLEQIMVQVGLLRGEIPVEPLLDDRLVREAAR